MRIPVKRERAPTRMGENPREERERAPVRMGENPSNERAGTRENG